MFVFIASSISLALAASSTSAPLAAPATSVLRAETCSLLTDDKAWLDRSMAAWNFSTSRITGIGRVKKIRAIIFDDQCAVTSDTAMAGGANYWSGTRHHGTINLPVGESIPAGVTSFTKDEGGSPFFVMSTPSVWRAAKIKDHGFGLGNLMTGVMLHEATHVAQAPTYGHQISAIADRYHLSGDFNDDSLQDHFGKNPDFAGSIQRETELFVKAADSPSRTAAKQYVRSALALIRARQAKYYVGGLGYFRPSEAIWLTFEGSGQWTFYKWLVDPQGANLPATAVRKDFAGDRHWSQGEGWAAVMALERLTGTRWKRNAFHLGRKDVLTMLDEAVAGRR